MSDGAQGDGSKDVVTDQSRGPDLPGQSQARLSFPMVNQNDTQWILKLFPSYG